MNKVGLIIESLREVNEAGIRDIKTEVSDDLKDKLKVKDKILEKYNKKVNNGLTGQKRVRIHNYGSYLVPFDRFYGEEVFKKIRRDFEGLLNNIEFSVQDINKNLYTFKIKDCLMGSWKERYSNEWDTPKEKTYNLAGKFRDTKIYDEIEFLKLSGKIGFSRKQYTNFVYPNGAVETKLEKSLKEPIESYFNNIYGRNNGSGIFCYVDFEDTYSNIPGYWAGLNRDRVPKTHVTDDEIYVNMEVEIILQWLYDHNGCYSRYYDL